MRRAVWDQALDAARSVHQSQSALQSFCPFPDDLSAQDVAAFDIPVRALMENDPTLSSQRHSGLSTAFLEAAPYALWRETYKGTDIGSDFMDRFGCYCLIGNGGAFMSQQMWAWMVYMPAQLWYPWHHHPGEEMYLILAGEAEFRRTGQQPEVLREGDTAEHTANQPHATQTHAHPVMAYVIWRNGFDVKPVLTPPDTLG